MSTTIPGSSKAVGNSGHTSDHNFIHEALSTELGAGVINVRHYDVVSSGSLDQTTEIEACDDLAVSSGRPLYFPAGTYRFDTTLLARTILGDGKAVTTLRYLGTGSAIGVADGTVRTYHRRVEDLTLQGGSTGVGLDLASASSGTYQNLILQDLTTGAHFRSPGTASYSLYNLFDNVAATGVTTGFLLDDQSNDNRFLSCRVNVANNYGWRINSGNHNTIRDGAIEQVGDDSDGSGSGDWGVYIGYTGTVGHTQNNVIEGTRFESNEGNLYIVTSVSKTLLLGNRFYATLNSNANGYYTDSGTGTLDYYNVTG